MQIKTSKDYIDLVKEKYPLVNKQTIKTIVNFGLRLIANICKCGANVYLFLGRRNKILFGNKTYNSLYHFNIYLKQLALKIRLMERWKKIPWDGWYYFCLSDWLHEEVLKLQKRRGRPRKYFKIPGYVMLYRIKDECYVTENNKPHLYRAKFPIRLNAKLFKKDFKPKKIEYLGCLGIRKLRDLLVTNYKYETLCRK